MFFEMEIKSMDIFYMAISLIFFGLSWGLVAYCERLEK